jgi:hypothetical protein
VHIIVMINKLSCEYIGLHSCYGGYEAEYWAGKKAEELTSNCKDDTEYIVNSVDKY